MFYFTKNLIRHLIPDSIWLRYLYRKRIGKKLNLKNPQTFNEKLQWLKLHDRKPEYTMMVDKYEVKQYVAEKIGEQYIIPTLGVWDKFDDIDFDSLPNQFVLKCTHDSGGLIIVKDKDTFDKISAKKKITRCLRRNYFWQNREWPYKNVKPRIIAEKFMSDSHEEGLFDYKFMCFNGKCKYIFTVTNRYSPKGLNVTFFDTNWNKQVFERHYKSDLNEINKPKKLDEMVLIAEKLSVGITFDRIDLYEIDGKIYFGEITFFPGSGCEEFNPEEWDKTLGDCLELSNNI